MIGRLGVPGALMRPWASKVVKPSNLATKPGCSVSVAAEETVTAFVTR